MELTKEQDNTYTWRGLSKGKLLAIIHAFEYQGEHGQGTPVGYDVIMFLRNSEVLDIDHPFKEG